MRKRQGTAEQPAVIPPAIPRLEGFENTIRLEQAHPAVLTVRFEDIHDGWSQWILLDSDRHHDSVHCVRDFERSQLDEMVKRQALGFDFGDLFDSMQGPKDPRASKDDIDPRLKTDSYFNEVVNTSSEFYRPYRKYMALVAEGNHESKVQKHYGYSLTQALVESMQRDGGITYRGWYGGWVRFMFKMRETVQQTFRLKYNHGTGISPIMTFGVLNTRRQASYLPDADIIINGHTHDSYCLPVARERISQDGTPYQDIQWHIRTPGYKDEYDDGRKGFTIEKGGGPKPIGCIWGRFFCQDSVIKTEFTSALR